MKRSSPYVITPVVKYGVQIDKNAKLNDLMKEIERLSGLKESRMAVVEVCNNKIYRMHAREDDSANHATNLRTIYRRTNELTVYECLTRVPDMPIQPSIKKKQVPIGVITYIYINLDIETEIIQDPL